MIIGTLLLFPSPDVFGRFWGGGAREGGLKATSSAEGTAEGTAEAEVQGRAPAPGTGVHTGVREPGSQPAHTGIRWDTLKNHQAAHPGPNTCEYLRVGLALAFYKNNLAVH